MKENILIFAYNMEKESSQLYAKMARESQNDFVKMVFKDLSEEESKHQEMLLKIIQRPSFGKEIPDIPDLKISETLDKPPLTSTMTPREIITYVIKMEEEAMILYQSLANATSNTEDRQIYKDLAKMEASHKYRFERVLQDIELWQR